MEASSMPNDYETDIFSRETLFPKKDRLFQGKDLSSLSSSVFRFQFSLIDWSVYRTVSQFIWIEQSCHGRFPIHSNADQIVPYAKKEANHVVRTNVKKKEKKRKREKKGNDERQSKEKTRVHVSVRFIQWPLMNITRLSFVDVMLYVCRLDSGRHLSRSRIYDRWSNQNEHRLDRSRIVIDSRFSMQLFNDLLCHSYALWSNINRQLEWLIRSLVCFLFFLFLDKIEKWD